VHEAVHAGLRRRRRPRARGAHGAALRSGRRSRGPARLRRKIDPSGIITTLAGTGVAGYSGDGGPANQAEINRPIDVEVGPDNSVYFTDVYNNCVRKIDTAGIISTVVGRCDNTPAGRGFSGDGGPPLEAKLDRPYGIDLAGTKLYVSDSYNNRIRVVNLPSP
jgi:hypothetical protein